MRKIALLICAATIIACGGGGGVSGGSGAVFPLTSKMRQYQAGDTASYQFSGSLTDLQTGQTISVSGPATSSCTSRNGTDVTISTSLTVSGNGRTVAINASAVYNQAADGSLQIVGYTDSNGTTHTTSSTTYTQPGTFSSPLAASGTTSFTDGSTLNSSFTVQGQQQVSTPAGTFATWKVADTSQGNGTNSTATDYWYPERGIYVRQDFTTTNSQLTLTGSMVLQSTNVM